MLVLEKGLAKYLGSYGNIAISSEKHDATMFGMRLLTGGHVYREQVLDYSWKSAVVDINFDAGEMDGAQMLLDKLTEGHDEHRRQVREVRDRRVLLHFDVRSGCFGARGRRGAALLHRRQVWKVGYLRRVHVDAHVAGMSWPLISRSRST